MREIKFRAWHEHKKEMVLGPAGDAVSPSWVLAMCSANNLDPMQYTGLKDSNGKEIYEGDDLSVEVQTAVDSFISFIEPVIWNEQLACFDFPNSSIHGVGFGAIGDKYTRCKIIGNIYEHPNLLSKE